MSERRCSSCKQLLPERLFDDGSSFHVYKTCLHCRRKKKVKYHKSLRSVWSTEPIPTKVKEEAHVAKVSPEVPSCPEPRTTPSVASLQLIIRSVVPCAQWIPVTLPESSYTCKASVVHSSPLFPVSCYVWPSIITQSTVQSK